MRNQLALEPEVQPARTRLRRKAISEIQLLVLAVLIPRLAPWVIDELARRLAARRWLPSPSIGPFRLGRYAIALAPTADTADTIGAAQ